MRMFGRCVSMLAVACALAVTGTARADMPSDDPCDGKAEGDACETLDGEAGSCAQPSGAGGSTSLTCVAEEESGCSVASVGTRAAAGSLVAFTLAALAFARLAKRGRTAA